MDKKFKVGDLVWAKMKGYPPWPAEIVKPPSNARPPKVKKLHHCVKFFGSNSYAWIQDKMISEHSQKLVEEHGHKKKMPQFKKAVETIIRKSKNASARQMMTAHDQKLVEEHGSKKKGAHLQKPAETATKESQNVTEHDRKLVEERENKRKYHPHLQGAVETVTGEGQNRITEQDRKLVEEYGIKNPHLQEDVAAVAEESRNALRSKMSSVDYVGLSGLEMVPSIGSAGRYEDYCQDLPDVGADSSAAGGYLSARPYVPRPETPPLDLLEENALLTAKNIDPIPKKIGFLGLGQFSRGIVKNLRQSGHSLIIYDKNPERCKPFAEELDIEVATDPEEVVLTSAITFCCTADFEDSKFFVFLYNGVLEGLKYYRVLNKGYVELTSVGSRTSEAVAREVTNHGGRYLNAPLFGSREDANEGTLLVAAAGDRSLYEQCESCFAAISKRHMYIGELVGSASNLMLTAKMFAGTVYGVMAETLAVLQREGLEPTDFFDMLKWRDLIQDACEKGRSMAESDYVANTRLKHVLRSINDGLLMESAEKHPLPIISAAQQMYNYGISLRYGDHDVAALFEATKH